MLMATDPILVQHPPTHPLPPQDTKTDTVTSNMFIKYLAVQPFLRYVYVLLLRGVVYLKTSWRALCISLLKMIDSCKKVVNVMRCLLGKE